MNELIDAEKALSMSYVDLMALIKETNRPPGGKATIREITQICFISSSKKVLDVGCNTGFCTFELARLAKCHTVGIDINTKMISVARHLRRAEINKELIEFKVADAINMPFPDNYFDVVISGGSTAFIANKMRALYEYSRVTKPWGFICDVNFYYTRDPPMTLIRQLSNILGIKIKPWKKKEWLRLYEKSGLELFYVKDNKSRAVSDVKIRQYVSNLLSNLDATENVKDIIRRRLISIYRIFNENNKHLGYSIFVLRKRALKEDLYLFEP
jgi:ubiquinone/menaquinone biosynthesis C-methylase UbiE